MLDASTSNQIYESQKRKQPSALVKTHFGIEASSSSLPSAPCIAAVEEEVFLPSVCAGCKGGQQNATQPEAS